VFTESGSRESGTGYETGLGRFATTHWSVVLAASASSSESATALEELCRTYWYPLYAYVRRCGHSAHDAQDSTQAFFVDLFQKNYLRAADRERGRFRSFLLTALRHFLAHEWEKARAAKRGGGQVLLPLDEATAESCYQGELANSESPEILFDRAWALRVFEQALKALRQEFADRGKLDQFEQLKSYLTEEPGPGAYANLGAELQLSPNAVAVTVHRLRQRYGELVREAVAHTVAQPSLVEEELRYLISLVSD
jgi:DNA-directed RNA polymerase specialized sigma24 family protein